MPLYTFRNTQTEEVVEISCKMDERDHVLEELGENWERVLMPVAIVAGNAMSLGKIDDGWNDVLKRVKSASGRKNTIQTK